MRSFTSRLNRNLIVPTLTLFALVAGVALEAEAARLSPEQQCRSVIERQSRRYLHASMRERQRCLRKIYKGELSSAVDCIAGAGDLRLAKELDSLRSRVAAQLPKQCTGVNFTNLGYPGPCGPPEGTFDVTDLERCIVDNHDEYVRQLLEVQFPTAQFVAPDFIRCVNRTGRNAADMIRGDVYARHNCLFQTEINPFAEATCREELPPFGRGTLDGRTDDRIRRAHIALLSGIPKACGNVDISRLDYENDCEDTTDGSFSSFDLKLCVYQEQLSRIPDLIEIAFPADPVCGDGDVEGDEECDDGNDVDTDACTSECIAAACGDGLVQSGVEECDDANTNQGDACLNDCSLNTCGDGFVNVGVESCDDGNSVDTDACRNTCVNAACGDGVICSSLSCSTGSGGGPEDCDDGNATDDDICGNDCAINFCGDGEVQAGLGEACDDGINNGNEPDSCRSTCTLPVCGDGIVDPGNGESCDDGNTTPGDNCDDNCTFELCGNGIVDDPSEECDDGNDVQTDGCLTNCRNNVCGDGFVNDGVENCDDGNDSNNDACLNDCTNNVCGDGNVNTGVEACDDGNDSDMDACLGDCTNNVCGDGFLNAGIEDCDDGAANSDTAPDACRSNCTLAGCGDGVTDSGEGCDDGAGNSDTAADACRTDCMPATCGDGVIDSGEVCDGDNDDVCAAEGSACGGSCTCANECPSIGEATVWAGVGETCSSDDECGPGTCIDGRCRTVSNLDSGWTGIAHGSDVVDQIKVRANLECGSAAPCGVCNITGIDPTPGNCRCANDNRTQCFNPFENDNDSCGGELCECFLGAPLPLSAGNTPACVVNKIREDITGTGNVDTGEGSITTNLSSVVHLGESIFVPCPFCVGDVTPDDGVRDGTCMRGLNDGQSCDANGLSASFPAPGGDGHSIDCLPDPGKNVSGSGLRIGFTQTTGVQTIGKAVTCGIPPFVTYDCHCGICSNDQTLACENDGDCGAGGTCRSAGNAAPLPDQCTETDTCIQDPNDPDRGICPAGPTDTFCDGIVRADGTGFVQCLQEADCAASSIGVDAGSCTLTKDRRCFAQTITARGQANPSAPIGAAAFCIPPTSNPGINTVAGLPGPGRVLTQASTRTFCSSDTSVQYEPGVGGCP